MVRSVALIAFAGVNLASCMRIATEDENDLAVDSAVGVDSELLVDSEGLWDTHYDLGTPMRNRQGAPAPANFARELKNLNIMQLMRDIKDVMYNNRGAWPADFGGIQNGHFAGHGTGGFDGDHGNYGPLFVRLAWHCSGTYRRSDGEGGCTGGRQRFEPERSWEDNANLDKARALLAPLKEKYGRALSWGDLIIAAGTVSAREMGAPIYQFCLGRHDDTDGTNSLPLGVGGDINSINPPCRVQGTCPEPNGAPTVGLIYVNPEGPQVGGGPPVPDPVLSAADIRDVFARMDQDDRATVALIGGGHAFGKSHGACSLPHAGGLPPIEAYAMHDTSAYEGLCGRGSTKGKGPNTVTSFLEGPWTTEPTQWDNEFFRWMLDREWELITGPGGKHQWRIKNAPRSQRHLMRFTTDIALINDDKYLALVTEFAQNQGALDAAFDDAWFKLTHRGGSWSAESRCDVGEVPAWVLQAGNNRMLDSDF